MAQANQWTSNLPRALTIIVGSCIAISSTAPVLAAQPAIEPESVASFDDIDFAISPIAGEITMRAQAGWIWREGQTNRIVLQDEVEVRIADHEFRAKGATIWLRKRLDPENNSATLYQIYAVFEELRSADGTISMTAKQLPVRGVIATQRPISLALEARFNEEPNPRSAGGQLRERGETQFAQRVLGQAAQSQPTTIQRPWSAPINPGPAEQADRTEHAQAADQPSDVPGQPKPSGPIFQPDGTFSVSIGGQIVIDGARSGNGSVITADGGVTIQYQSPSTKEWIDFRSQRVVIYTRGDEPISGVSKLGTGQIEGIYLEGGVYAGDNQWSIRSPRMYLDVTNNKALMLDTVFWTTDQKTSMPLYLRAQSVRQTARDEFAAKNATISNTAFFSPDVTLGIKDIKVTLSDQPGAETPEAQSADQRPTVHVKAKSVTLKAGPVPVLWLPGFKGDPSSFPLRQIQVGDSNRSGLAIQTRWNAISLFNIDAPPGVRLDLDLDYYAERGFATGFSGQWSTREHRGGLFSYLLPEDNGTDITAPGKRIDRDGETRGIFAAHDIWRVTNQWTLISELSYISDEAFVPAFFDDLSRKTEAFRNRVVLERLSDNTLFSLELGSTLNDFIVPEHQLQSPGYSVNKVPEARFVSLAKDLLPDYKPGLLTYSFEARAGVLRLSFSEVDAKSYGFNGNSLASDAFGTTTTQSLGDKFRALGLDEGAVSRLDTRHELNARLDLGPLRINPFIVGRVSAYGDSFTGFSPNQNDDLRFWGGGGVTLSTTISKVDDSIESRFFDVHRIRHIIEPSLTIWGADSNFEQSDLPIFDDDVEGLAEGTMIRAAVDQTWQTKRGGIGRWRDVDLLKLRSEYVYSGDNAGNTPIPDFYSSRPELSNPGEYFATSMVLQPTEILAIAGEWVYDIEQSSTAKSSIGVILENRPGFTTSIEYREVQPLDATFASLGASYRLSDKYALSMNANYNFRLEDFQTFNTSVLRKFQIGTLGATIRYDNIRGETSLGFIFRPLGSSRDLPVDTSWGG